MRIYRNTKVILCSPNGDTYFDVVAGARQGDTLASYLFKICLDYKLRASIDLIKENSFTLKKKVRCRQHPAETTTDTDYADDLALLTNAPSRAESLLHSLEQAVEGVGLYMDRNKTVYEF